MLGLSEVARLGTGMTGNLEVSFRGFLFVIAQRPSSQDLIASNYGDAGAVDLFGPKYGLPKAISTANNYWICGPCGYTGQSLILMDEDSPEKYVKSCKSLVLVARPDDPYARPDENRPIYHCIGLTRDLQTL